MNKTFLFTGLALLLTACAGPQVTRTQPLSEAADAPYDKIMVLSMFKSYDMRRYLEKEVVRQLEAKGVEAVASTSQMDVKTPVNRDTVLAAVAQNGANAVVVTQLLDSATTSRFRDRNPRATYNVRPTYYYNVWDVELTEYVEPKGLEATHEFTMATQVFSVSTKEPVWAIETHSKLKRNVDQQFSGTSIADEASAIVRALSSDGLLAR